MEECCAPTGSIAEPAARWRGGRTIGPWGTTVRAIAGIGAIAAGVAVPHEHPLLGLPGASSTLIGVLVGLVAMPLLLTAAIRARGRDAPVLRLGHGAASTVTLLTLGVAQLYPVAVLVTIGAPLVLLAAVGRNGCELLAVPNLVLRRNDYLFCLPFSPIDAWEHRRRALRQDSSTGDTGVSNSPTAGLRG